MRQNPGEAFFHPVTHQLIQPGQIYNGAAHLEHENEEIIDNATEDEAGEEIIDNASKDGEKTSKDNSKNKKGDK